MLPVLRGAGHDVRFAVGLVTSAGSAGLLLPPSLALILFAVVAGVSIVDLFLASLLPAAIMIFAIGAWAMWRGIGQGLVREPFDAGRIARAAWAARWELLTPVIALGGIFGGLTTLLEAAAITVAYSFVVLCLLRREIAFGAALGAVVVRSSVLVGGVFVILSMAMALTSFLIDAQIPDKAAAWAVENIGSKMLFLLALNLVLLLAGCLMDVFSAIAVLTPLLMPVGLAFGLSPLHLAVVFLANLELGYLTPPVGMNLYLAAYRFEKPLLEVVGAVLPVLLVMLAAVLAIAYLPLVLPFPGF